VRRPDLADIYAGLPALAAHCDEQREICFGDGYTAETLADAWKKLGDAARDLEPLLEKS
jgi:hypothetical protein